jgi:hypothetical protein
MRLRPGLNQFTDFCLLDNRDLLRRHGPFVLAMTTLSSTGRRRGLPT